MTTERTLPPANILDQLEGMARSYMEREGARPEAMLVHPSDVEALAEQLLDCITGGTGNRADGLFGLCQGIPSVEEVARDLLGGRMMVVGVPIRVDLRAGPMPVIHPTP